MFKMFEVTKLYFCCFPLTEKLQAHTLCLCETSLKFAIVQHEHDNNKIESFQFTRIILMLMLMSKYE